MVLPSDTSQGNPLKSKCDHKLNMFKQRKSTQILAVSKPPRRNDADPAQKVELSQALVSDHPATSKIGNTRFTVVLGNVMFPTFCSIHTPQLPTSWIHPYLSSPSLADTPLQHARWQRLHCAAASPGLNDFPLKAAAHGR